MLHSIITKAEAIRQSKARYFTGEPCRRGHVSERFTSSGNCCECAKLLFNKKREKKINKIKLDYPDIMYIERKDAQEIGRGKYFTGSKCKYGHVSERVTANGVCIECAKIARANLSRDKKDKKNARARELRLLDSDKVKQRRREYNRLYSEKVKREITEEGKEKRTTYYREYMRKKRKNPEYQALCSLRGMLRRVLGKVGTKKEARSEVEIGYTSKELKMNIESKFKDGMNWENRSEWHIDHIKPIKAFLDEGIKDPKVINSLDNLQPLWVIDNLKKGANY